MVSAAQTVITAIMELSAVVLFHIKAMNEKSNRVTGMFKKESRRLRDPVPRLTLVAEASSYNLSPIFLTTTAKGSERYVKLQL